MSQHEAPSPSQEVSAVVDTDTVDEQTSHEVVGSAEEIPYKSSQNLARLVIAQAQSLKLLKQ